MLLGVRAENIIEVAGGQPAVWMMLCCIGSLQRKEGTLRYVPGPSVKNVALL